MNSDQDSSTLQPAIVQDDPLQSLSQVGEIVPEHDAGTAEMRTQSDVLGRPFEDSRTAAHVTTAREA